ncbi:DUF6089 family protein [Flavihumibacter solisilvae]|uniref:DUF6089 domain-containing protein n=1 Tax=Flavihumibacter solisilvae TaxID=1349421 RepID=A0A0C1IHR0_9BACT|nr:DUF6089 family protein [Flavihumibacter solisilvae]KIC93750.1 hypothetical protein OI18_15380 [Flavihumibacter solisilvae]
MRRIILLSLALLPVTVMAQRWHITGFGGVSNYQGDLQEKRLTTQQSHGSFGLGAQYDFSARFSVRGGFVYGRISGDDKVNNDELLRQRNLNFSSQLLEGNLLAEFRLFDLDEKWFTPYVFAGIGVFGYDPYTFDTAGHKIYLQPLGTEGQGLDAYPDRKLYSRVQVALPFGAGIKFRVTERVTLGYEIGLRKTFTDYLDDLSTTYVDEATLLAGSGAKAVELAFRGDELKDVTLAYPEDGTIRGGDKVKDWYYFQGITIGFRLFNSSGQEGRIRSGRQLDCPRF